MDFHLELFFTQRVWIFSNVFLRTHMKFPLELREQTRFLVFLCWALDITYIILTHSISEWRLLKLLVAFPSSVKYAYKYMLVSDIQALLRAPCNCDNSKVWIKSVVTMAQSLLCGLVGPDLTLLQPEAASCVSASQWPIIPICPIIQSWPSGTEYMLATC